MRTNRPEFQQPSSARPQWSPRPLFGLLSDKVGKRAFFMMLGSFLLMPVYLLMAYSNATHYGSGLR